MDEGGEPVRVTHWFAAICAFSVAGTAFGESVGLLLSVLSGDYVVVPSDYAGLGLRAGLFAATVLAAWRAAAPKPEWGMNALLRALGAAALAAGGVTGLVAVLAVLLSLAHGVVPEHAILAHPRRYVVFVAIHHSWPYAMTFGMILSGLRLLRGRAA
jgi:hypothetical protein